MALSAIFVRDIKGNRGTPLTAKPKCSLSSAANGTMGYTENVESPIE